MNDADIAAAPLGQLREVYRQAAIENDAAVAKGRHRVANRQFELLVSLAREFRARGRQGQQVFEELLGDPENAVRAWAASHALPFATKAAEAVLAQIAAGPPSPIRLSAEMTLREWKAGRLSQP